VEDLGTRGLEFLGPDRTGMKDPGKSSGAPIRLVVRDSTAVPKTYMNSG
jgi:hypothetical protein